MRRLSILAFLLLWGALSPSVTMAAGPWGWDCRQTSGYVTDNAPQTYLLSGVTTDDYPVTRNGITFGWTTNAETYGQGRDRNAGADPRFAGTCWSNDAANPISLQVDLPATGSYDIRLAFGDNDGATAAYTTLYDNTTVITTLTGTTGGAAHFIDATGVNRTSGSDWITNNVAVTYNFASTVFLIKLGDGGSNGAAVAHLLITQNATSKLQTKTSSGKLFSITGGSGALQAK